MKKRTLLIIGEEEIKRNRPYVSFLQFRKYAHKLKDKAGFALKVIDYEHLLCGQIPGIDTPQVLVVLFFPYRYWNRHIEIYPDRRIYGDEKFGQEFRAFFKKVEQALNRHYGQKRIKYLNPPWACYLDRDKMASKRLLVRAGLPTPRTFRVRELADIQRLLNQGLRLYVKPRFGAMGKGITYIDHEQLVSNFLFRKGKIVSRPYDFNWRFTRIKDREDFLQQLLKGGFIFEEAVVPATFKERRFDFRVYVMFGQVVYLYAKSSPLQFWVTNWSQGGKIDKRKVILRTIPQEKIALLHSLARRTARTLRLNFVGVDIILSKDMRSAFILEGNAFPGYERGFDLMQCLLKFLVKRL